MANQKSKWKCCSDSKVADTGLYSKGKHNHAPTQDALDHPWEEGFRADASTTKAYARLMRNIGYYRRGEIPPPAVS